MHYSNYFLAGLTALAAEATAECSREMLQAATASLIAAQTAGSSSGITALSDTVTYTQNAKAATISTGILSQALKIDHNRSSYDTTQCATYTELIVTDTAKPYVIGTQMHFTDSKITKVETLVTTTGDWLFNAKNTLKWAITESWAEIPSDKRDSRAVIQAAADAYCDIFNNKSVVVPWGKPCARLEGGSYTGNGSASDRCDVGIPSGVALTNRRYVIDETVGAVDVFLTFGGNLPDSHEFRVEGGKLRYVHTLTVMT
ncbi:Uncharacterized protein BP5553_05101 [Venustampulla echinocandica]|uniref:DUF8021 domain-containing protein n=1 Tax=Venustampulla echinocandica TaxID=2656787 RepID=A0A370TQ76_9HELO|nr:Uncharacterized protein BP5553_05101 [Venustampulla echinocandica]RDL37668.1 Uncharacterized protein BP5553_05101 [Venustampulla echinocandica]